MVCGTAALHRQASTAVQQLVLENSTVTVVISESVVVLDEIVVTMCVAVRRALFAFDISCPLPPKPGFGV